LDSKISTWSSFSRISAGAVRIANDCFHNGGPIQVERTLGERNINRIKPILNTSENGSDEEEESAFELSDSELAAGDESSEEDSEFDAAKKPYGSLTTVFIMVVQFRLSGPSVNAISTESSGLVY
jgi:hypothetical protein